MSEEYLTALDECSWTVDQLQAEIDELTRIDALIKKHKGE